MLNAFLNFTPTNKSMVVSYSSTKSDFISFICTYWSCKFNSNRFFIFDIYNSSSKGLTSDVDHEHLVDFEGANSGGASAFLSGGSYTQ